MVYFLDKRGENLQVEEFIYIFSVIISNKEYLNYLIKDNIEIYYNVQ